MEQDLINMGNNQLNHEMEQVDKLVTRMLNTARKKAEGMRRDVPHSKEKEKRYVALCLKEVLRLKRGIAGDEVMMKKRKSTSEIEDVIEETSLEIKERLSVAKDERNDVIQHGKEIGEKSFWIIIAQK